MIDAMVALMILAVATTFSLDTVATAARVVRHADELRRAKVVLTYVMASASHAEGARGGHTDGFTWQVVNAPTGADRPIALCRRAISMVADQSRRRFSAATLEACPEGAD